MQITPDIELLAGIGPTFLYTFFESFGYETESKQISTSYMLAGIYTHQISDRIRLGGELKYYHINKIEDQTISLQIMFRYKLLDW